MHLAEPLVGAFLGEYLVARRLGRGGFGRVVLGLQRPHFKLPAAIKLLDIEGLPDAQAGMLLEKFQNEAKALAVLRHPNIVSLLRFGRLGGQPFLAMEYVPGGRTLRRVLEEAPARQLPIAIVQRILEQVLRGLEGAHRAGIIHRDLKPENLMLEEIDGDPWRLKIVDFGLAKDIQQRQHTSIVVGTMAYMAPEQFTCSDLGPWTDLYALGVLTFLMLTGRDLFDGTQYEVLAQKKAPFDRAPIAEVVAALPEALRHFFARALAATPSQRFTTTAAFRRALNVALGTLGGEPLVPPDSSEGPAFGALADTQRAPTRPRRRFIYALAALATAGGLGVAAAGFADDAGHGAGGDTGLGDAAPLSARGLGPSGAAPRAPSLVSAVPIPSVVKGDSEIATDAVAAPPVTVKVDTAPSNPALVRALRPSRTSPSAASPASATTTAVRTTLDAGSTSTPGDALPTVRKADAADLPDLRKKAGSTP